ncbi:MAG: tannase/feruloyl esterase family alpha/beta hydrolase [Steroidobacteraceae bacterium]
MRPRLLQWGGGLLVIGTLHAPAFAATSEQARCAALAQFQAPGISLQISAAALQPAGTLPGMPGAAPVAVPAHCRVDGQFDARTGTDGKPYAIRFAVAMPVQWNGRFLMQGGGGLNGSVGAPLGATAAGDQNALARGFAVASTDSGHAGSVFDGAFFADQQAALDFLYQAVPKVTAVAKQVVKGYYGSSAHHAYFVGCSTGGREAMMMSQRFPDYFDGIVAGAPAMRTNFSNLGLRWVATALNGVAPRDPKGMPQTRLALSDNDRKLIIDGVLAACDAQDGAKDGLVFAPQSCGFDPATLSCKGGTKTEGCLTAAQIEAVKKAMAGPKTADGRQVYPGFLYDTGIATTRGLPGPLAGPMIPEGAPAGMSIDVDAESARANDARSMVGDTHAWTNLGTFRDRGGKLIFFHGVSDPWFSAIDTLQYYERLAKDSPAPIQDWSRLFLVPGMGHCSGGEATLDRFDMVDAIVKWVEQRQAPDAVIATGASMPGQSRPLCPVPKVTRYGGSGDASSAASYRCE